jgi:peroxiredoxin
MLATPFTCPGCGTEFRPAGTVQASKPITCPLCGNTFAASESEPPSRADASADNDVQPPRARFRRRPQAPPTNWPVILGVGALGVGMLAIVGVVIAVLLVPMWMAKEKRSPDPSPDASQLPFPPGEPPTRPPPEVGKPAPLIVAEDLNGKLLRLSEHRGKVVLLDFWASSSPACRQQFPSSKKLIRRLEKEPFVLLGVNEDDTLDNARQVVQAEQLPWRSWRDDGELRHPLARRWGVGNLPTTYLIDHQGVIRYRFEGPQPEDAIDRAVDELLQQAKKEQGRK